MQNIISSISETIVPAFISSDDYYLQKQKKQELEGAVSKKSFLQIPSYPIPEYKYKKK